MVSVGHAMPHGTPTNDDFAGSGGGLLNPVLIQGLLDGDHTADNPVQPAHRVASAGLGPAAYPGA